MNTQNTNKRDDIEKIASHCQSVLRLEKANFSTEYSYKNLSLCVIDAVWSIGVRYEGVKNVIGRYDKHFPKQRKISEMLSEREDHGIDWFTKEVFQNTQRTSTQNGILKSEAVFRFASVLHCHKMDSLEDIPKITWYKDLQTEMQKPYAQEILTIPGQRSGISLAYFYMLTGSTGIVKPDRMVITFLEGIVQHPVGYDQAQSLLSYASRHLNTEFPLLTPRALDHEIWKYQRR
jgi:hypothetical protein